MDLGERTAALKAILDAKPGAEASTVAGPRSRPPTAMLFKVKGRMFVILKSDPHLAELLREQYAGVGHRSHLDRRFWISVSLDADVPADEVERLVANSYELVREGLTRKQKAELAALAS